jgi:hypothetical protein
MRSILHALTATLAVRAYVSPIFTECLDSTGNRIDCSVFDLDNDDDFFLDDLADDKVAEWDCDIRSWTRAPDLIPGHQIPGETRLWVNGTGCKDIELWELGLRLKERAIVKVRYVPPHVGNGKKDRSAKDKGLQR